MTKSRNEIYVWVKWLSQLMSGDINCQWAPWFKSHYTGYKKMPSDFQLAVWTVEHTQLLDDLVKQRVAMNEATYLEDQNSFKVNRPSGLIIAGKPDLVTVDINGHCKVFDAKTGSPKQSDIIQVMLYMMCLPFASPLYKGKRLNGCVVYKGGTISEIPEKAVDDAFKKQVKYFLIY